MPVPFQTGSVHHNCTFTCVYSANCMRWSPLKWNFLPKQNTAACKNIALDQNLWVSGLWVTETPLPLPSAHPPHTFFTITSSHTPLTPSHTPLTRPHTRYDSCHDTAPEVSALHATWPWLDTHPPGGGREWENAPADSNGAEKPGTALQGCCDWSTRSLLGYVAELM